MIVSLIVAMDRNGVIGANGRLPWRLPADLLYFKAVTLWKPIIMGRRTHESIGRVLPGRENIILTRDPDYRRAGCTVLHSIAEVFGHCGDALEIMIMGGADLYRQMLDRAGRIYLTEVHADVAGDTVFPQFDRKLWRELERHDFPADQANEYSYSFVVLERGKEGLGTRD